MKKIIFLFCLVFTQFLMAQGPGCPNVDAGPGQTVDCDNACVNLSATFLETGETTSYDVSSIPFNPPSNFNGLANQLFVNIDDIWSGVVNLPFDFCFFGQDYDQLIVGANGGISFDVSNANAFNDWSFTDTLPNATDTALSDVNIFGAVHDIDPNASNGTHEIGWEVKGTAPCRTFVVSYFNVAHFSCNALKTHQMMVLYEGTNTIEVYILDKPTCTSWNSGNAVIGIQNPAGTVAYTPPGRNTGNWSASIEAWRFTPNGMPNYVLTWYDGSNTPIGNSPTINVCPTSDETYTAEVEYTNCNGEVFTDSDTVTVTVDLDTVDASFDTTATCDGGTVTLTGDGGGTFAFNPDPGDGAVINPTTGTVTGGTPGTTYTIEYTIDGAGTCDAVNTETVTVLTVADPTFTTTATCDGGTTTITGDLGGIFTFNPDLGDGASINPTTGEITGGTSGTTYTIEYTIIGTCGDSSIETVTALSEDDASFTMNPSCEGGTATITGVTGGTFAFNPDLGDGASVDPNSGEVTGGTAGTTYTIEYSTTGACAASTTQNVTVLSAGDATFAMTATCDGGTATISGQTGGTFVFNPDLGDGASINPTTGVVTGGTAGTTYTIEYTTPAGSCSATETETVTVLPAEDASFTTTATCDGGTVTITGDAGGIFAFNPDLGDGASISSTTGTVTGGTSGTTYTIEYTTTGVCPEVSTQNVTALSADDASFTMTATCDGGTATINGTTGGAFALNPAPGDGASISPTTGTVTGGSPGTIYTVEYTTVGVCAANSTETVTVLPSEDASFTVLENCEGGMMTILGDTGGIFVFNPVPTDSASINPNTGEITGGTPGTTYIVEYTTGGPCPDNSFQNATVLPADDPTFMLTATCTGGTASISGTTGGIFAFNPVPTDGATVNPTSGTVVGVGISTTYTVEYTTAGACPESSIQNVTMIAPDDASFTPTPTCDGGTITVDGVAGGTFAFNPAPGDGASINTNTGTITGGTPGSTYTIEYTTNGTCPNSSTENVTANPLPVVINPTPLIVCDDSTPDGLTLIDLNVKNNEISGNNANYAVTYYLTQIDADNASPQLTIPYPNIANGQFVFVRVEDLTTGCYDTTTLELQVEQAPIAFTPVPLEYCDPNSDGFGEFDLHSTANEITGGDPDLVVSYHGTMQNAMDNVIPLSSLYSNIDPYTQPIFVRVESSTIVTDCAAFVELQLIVHDTPAIELNLTALEECDDDTDGFTVFDLTERDADVLNSLDPTRYIVTYYESQIDAENPINNILNPTTYNSDNQIIWVRVEDNTNGCATVTSLELIVNPIPVIVNPSPLELCDDAVADEMTIFDLTIKNDEITGANPDWTVEYFETNAEALAGTPAISPDDAYMNTSVGGNPPNPQTIFVRVTNAVTGCYSFTTLTLRVNPLPVPLTPADLYACDINNDGFDNSFDLDSQTLIILNGALDQTVSYHETQEDADNGNNSLSSLYSNIDPNIQPIFVRVEDDITGCFNATVVFQLIVQPSPEVPTDLPPLMACDDNNDGFTQFDLNDENDDVLGTQNPADFTLTYHLSLINAQDGLSPIVEPNLSNFNNISNPQTIYVRLENNTNGCVTTGQFELIVNLPPVPLFPAPLELCDDDVADEMTVFDLTIRDNDITGGMANWVVEYYETDADAQAGISMITPANAYTNRAIGPNLANPQTLYVRVINSDTGCYAFTTLTIRVLPNPSPNSVLNDLELCDDNSSGDLIEEFDLTQNEADIVIVAGETATYYNNLADAEVGANPIATPNSYFNTDPTETIYVRVTNDITGCYTIVSFNIQVNPLPDALATVDDIIVCEVMTDNVFTFDLTDREDAILNGQSTADFAVTYHLNLSDAETTTGAIANPSAYNNSVNPEQIFVNITNIATGCDIAITSFFIEVQNGAEANSDMATIEYILCDDNMEFDGNTANDSVEFDLSTQDEFVLDGQSPADFTVTYYLSQVDADAMANQLNNLYNNIINPQQIHVRVDNNLTSCYALSTLTLFVNPIPVFDIDDLFTICANTNGTEEINPPVIDTGLSTLDYTFEWTNESGTLVGTDSSYSPTIGGTYTVVVTTTDGTLCSSSDTTVVQVSSPPMVVADVTSQAFAENNIIEATATGDPAALFEFSIDNGPWVSNDPNTNSYIFMDVSPGEHTITARDIFGCGLASTTVLVLDYPLFFTPNSDGYNDTWQISGISNQFDAKIYIFDRYGKLLKQLNPSGTGWDGTLNGAPLPSSDYWFTVDYREPSDDAQKQFKAHFTLKR